VGLINIDLKSEGIDPAVVADILKRADSVSKRLDWLSLAAVSIVTQIAAKFHFDLPPQS